MKTVEELKAAYEWGKETIRQMRDAGEKIPEFMYERLLEIADRIVEAEKN